MRRTKTDEEEIKEIIEKTKRIVMESGLDGNFKDIAFREVLRHLLASLISRHGSYSPEGSLPEAKPVMGTVHVEDPLKEMSFEEFCAVLDPTIRSNAERLTASVYWLSVKEGIECVKSEMIRELLKESPIWSPPGNLPRDLMNARRKGWLSKRDGCWNVTSLGKRTVLEWIKRALEHEDTEKR